MSELPLVSVVVPTYNSESHLDECLRSIEAQSYDPIELLVVDNDSTDRTRQIASRYTDAVYNVGTERSSQVNFGFRVAEGTYLYRVDSDFELEPDVVEKAVERCQEGADAVCIHNTSDPTVSVWSNIRKFERDFYRGDDLNVAARFFRREVVETVGGFDEDLIAGEDYDLHNRILKAGFEIEQIDTEEIHLDEPETLRDVVSTHYRYGKTVRHFLAKHPDRGSKQIGFVRQAYLRKWPRFVRNPLLTIGLFVYQLIRFTAAGVGWAVSNLPPERDPAGSESRAPSSTDRSPLVSIVIPTYNVADPLDRCLLSIEDQTHDAIETIVVDAYSEDGTASVVEEHEAKLVLSDDDMSEARNTGIEHASGDFLLSIDADMVLEPDLVERCLGYYRSRRNVGGVSIPERSIGDSFWVRVRDFERSFYAGTAVESPRFFPIDVVRSVRGFDEEVTFFEDSTLPRRIERDTGLDVDHRLDAGYILHDESGFTLSDWLGKKYRYGKSADRYIEKYGDVAQKQTDPIARLGIFLRYWDRFLSRPLLAAGTLALKMLEYLAIHTGRLASKLERRQPSETCSPSREREPASENE